jgi:hypothetical protein
MQHRLLAVAVAIALSAAGVAAQTDVSLEMLVRAAENRLGVFAWNLRTGATVAVNADAAFPAGALAALGPAAAAVGRAEGAETRPTDPSAEFSLTRALLRAPAAEAAASVVTPRAAANDVAALRRTAALDPTGVLARAFGESAREPFGGALSPFVETGAFLTGDPAAPGVVGYVLHPRGEVIVAALTRDFRSGESAAVLLPAVVAAAVMRAAGAISEPAAAAAAAPAEGEFAATLHETTRDAAVFAPRDLGDGRAVVAERQLRTTSAFKIGETARLAVIGFPARRARVAVQWSIPGTADGRLCAQSFLDSRTVGERLFDLPLIHAGTYTVRVVVDGRLLLEQQFFATKP